MKLLAFVLAALIATTASMVVLSAEAEAATHTGTIKSTTLRRGDVVKSGNGACQVVFQGDQNVVVYHGAKAIWATSTVGSGADRLVMQGDGNLVLYKGSRAIWHTGTHGHTGARLAMQNDCNLVIYTKSNKPVWNTQTGRTTAKVAPKITMSRGASAPHGYWYKVALTGYPAHSSVKIKCHDSVDRGGFYTRTVKVDSLGKKTLNACYSADGPDHWITAGTQKSNVVVWGGTTAPPTTTSPLDPPPGQYDAVFAAARAKYPAAQYGTPINDPHTWGPVIIQDLRGGSYGDTALILNPQMNEAFPVRSGFWEHYKDNGGPSHFGAPTSAEGCVQEWRGVDCWKVPAQQEFTSGQSMWFVREGEVFSGEFYSNSTPCPEKQHWLHASHYGVGKAVIVSLEPTAIARMSLFNDGGHAWNEWEDCLARPHWLDAQQYDSLYDQLDCHLIFAAPLLNTGGTHFDFESWRSPVSFQYYADPTRIFSHSCNW